MRIPDWLFVRLERVYRAQKRIRIEEDRRELLRQDREFRAACERQLARHRAGQCGGAAAGCGYVPCVPRVSPY